MRVGRWLLGLGLAMGVAQGSEAHAAPCPSDLQETVFQGTPPVGPVAEDLVPDSLPALPGPGDARELPEETADALHAMLQTIVTKTAVTGVSVAVWQPGVGLWRGAVGLAARGEGRREMTPDTPMWWASIGKVATAEVVRQLVAEGRLAYDETLADVGGLAAKVPHAEQITVRQLLLHTSGLFSFNEDRKLRETSHYRTPAQLLRVVRKQGPMFCPTEAWRYTNTGYLLLALAIEARTGGTYAHAVRERVLSPLTARGFTPQVLDAGPVGIPEMARPHPEGGPAGSIEGLATVSGAGALWGTATDLLAVWRQVLTGEAGSGDAAMEGAFGELHQMFGAAMYYGEGVVLYEPPGAAPDGSAGRWLGHSGGAPGLKTLVVWDTQRKVMVAVLINDDTSAEATAFALLRTLDVAPN